MFKSTHPYWRRFVLFLTFVTLSVWIILMYLAGSKSGKIDLLQSAILFSVSCMENFSSAIRRLFYTQSRSHSSLKQIAVWLVWMQWEKSLFFFSFFFSWFLCNCLDFNNQISFELKKNMRIFNKHDWTVMVVLVEKHRYKSTRHI